MSTSDQKKRAFVIAVDAMGGDNAPGELVAGAVEAARQQDVEIILVGDRAAVEAELARHRTDGLAISISASERVIQETDHPLQALREKPRASMIEAAKAVKSGNAHAMVTMGPTGAAMASCTLVLGLVDGVERPAIAGPMLRPLSLAVLIDLGSNMDCRPSQLLNFGAIGVAFVRSIEGVDNPRVALLSVGAEEGKGNRLVKEAYPLFRDSGLNFVGNVEGTDLFLDKADVVVCDGFVGNVLMKFTEGLGPALAQRVSGLLEDHIPPEVLRRVTGDVAALTSAVELAGGGPLFGINGHVIVGHGRSRAASVTEAISMARRIVEVDLVQALRREIAALRQPEKE